MPVGVGGAGLVAVGVPGVVHWCVHGCGEAQVGGEGAGFGIVAGGLQLPNAIVGFMLVWLVLGYADILWVNMANAAHTAGLITGCVMAALISLLADKRKASR